MIPEPQKRISVLLMKKDSDRIERLARCRGLSVSAYIRLMLIDHLKDQDQGK